MTLESRRPHARIIPMKRYDDEDRYTDLNAPSSPGYAERNRQKVTEIAPGMLRIDIGSEGD